MLLVLGLLLLLILLFGGLGLFVAKIFLFGVIVSLLLSLLTGGMWFKGRTQT